MFLPVFLLLGFSYCASLDIHPVLDFYSPIPIDISDTPAPSEPYYIPIQPHASRRHKRATRPSIASPRFLPKPQYGILFSRKGFLAYDVLTRHVSVSAAIPPYPAYTPFTFTTSHLCTPWISKVPSYYRQYEATNFQELRKFFRKIRTAAHDAAQDSSQTGILRSTCLFQMISDVYAAFTHRVQYEQHVATLKTLAGQLPTPLFVAYGQWAIHYNATHNMLHNTSFVPRDSPLPRVRRESPFTAFSAPHAEECDPINFFSTPDVYDKCRRTLKAKCDAGECGTSNLYIFDYYADDLPQALIDAGRIEHQRPPLWNLLTNDELGFRIGGYLVYHYREFATLRQEVDELANRTSDGYSLLNQTILYVNSSMHALADRIVTQLTTITEPVEKLYHSQIVQDLFQAQNQFITFEATRRQHQRRATVQKFRDFLQAARTHHFTPSIANTTFLLSLLHTLQTTEIEEYRNWQLLLLPDALHYLQLQQVQITNNAFHLTGRFPIYYKPNTQPLHTVYNVQSTPLPAKPRPTDSSGGRYDYTVLDHVPDLLAVSDSTTLQLSQSDLQQCHEVQGNYYCSGTFLSFPAHLAPCIAKIFLGHPPEQVSDVCTVSYEFAKAPQPAILDSDRFLLLSDLHHFPWNLVCGDTHRAMPLTPQPFAVLDKIHLCHCALTCGPFHFSKLPLGCPETDHFPDFKFQFIPNAFVYGALSNIPDYNLSQFSPESLTQLSDHPIYFGFTPPKVADLVPHDSQGKFLTPPVLPKRLPLNETLHAPYTEKTYFHDFSHLIARTHSGIRDLFKHGTTHQKVAMALKIVFGSLFSIAFLVGIGFLIRMVILKKHPRIRRNRQSNMNRRMLNRVVKAAPIVAAGASGGQSAAILTALNVLSQNAQTAHANPIPTPPTPAVMDVFLTTTDSASTLIETMKMHEIMWTVGFALVLIASIVLFLWKRCQYRSNILPSLFPIFPRSVLHHGVCRCDLFLHISSHVTGEVLVAHLQPCGLSPFDIFLSQALSRDRITIQTSCLPSCIRPTKIDIDWTDIILYDKFDRHIPLRNFAIASIFTTSDLKEIDPSHPYSVQLMGRFLGHCMNVKIKPRSAPRNRTAPAFPGPSTPAFTDEPPSYSPT